MPATPLNLEGKTRSDSWADERASTFSMTRLRSWSRASFRASAVFSGLPHLRSQATGSGPTSETRRMIVVQGPTMAAPSSPSRMCTVISSKSPETRRRSSRMVLPSRPIQSGYSVRKAVGSSSHMFLNWAIFGISPSAQCATVGLVYGDGSHDPSRSAQKSRCRLCAGMMCSIVNRLEAMRYLWKSGAVFAASYLSGGTPMNFIQGSQFSRRSTAHVPDHASMTSLNVEPR
mmetsp:Transcript_69546/g.215141  ORF Transcript_69546/g.215141 Transcript_69546/m.215141 type:complete len:231 (-) Transcript_69546:59-751(-)